MDISKEYIKMCEKAIKIQKAWKPQYGDFKISLYRGGNRLPSPLRCDLPYVIKNTKNLIWLPRQDQLQDMAKGSLADKIHNFEHFSRCASDVFDGNYVKVNSSAFTSMEQLWLAFVMQKCKKIWDGENWLTQQPLGR